ncbi:MAG: DegT/DnrJ/EryC1/StrS family aminotransferase [Clostridia bacterium]|nr:DegT/DnrJ/EryC1/StrS family aminotransferase [Clostridia bacterium]
MKEIPVMIPYIGEEEKREVEKVLASGWVAQGPKVKEFEEKVASYENTKYGIATTSCTTALHLALVALGVREGQDVIVPAFTFVATANSVLYTGATPILVDVHPTTYNIVVEEIERTIQEKYENKNGELINKQTGNKLTTLVPVNLFGLCADLPRINEIAKKYNLKVLEDSACAFGAKIGDKYESEFGNPTCLSFHPRKSITTGEGGMILTSDEEIYKITTQLRSHGASVSEIARHKNAGYLLPDFNDLGYNYRMTDIQAAVGVAQMDKMTYITETRRTKADLYRKLLEKVDFINPPVVPENYYHTYQSFVCMIDNEKLNMTVEEAHEFRNELMEKLEENKIATRVGTHAVHMLGYYKEKFGYKSKDFDGAYKADSLSITLPLYVQMTDEDQEYVINKIVELKEKIVEGK